MGRILRIIAVAVAGATLVPAAAQATYPGEEGRLALVVIDSESRDYTQPDRLVTMVPDGSRVRVIHECPSDDCGYLDPRDSVGWSPDGKRIAVATGGNGPWERIAVANADGSRWKVLPHGGPGHQLQPEWSPDGRKIAFLGTDSVSGSLRPQDIFMMHSDGTHVKRLTRAGAVEAFTWSSRNEIAYVNRSYDDDRLVRIDSRGRHHRTLARGGNIGAVDWSPGGTRLLFTRSNTRSPDDPDYVNHGPQGTWMVGRDGKHPHVALRGTSASMWSPTGREVLIPGPRLWEYTTNPLDGTDATTEFHLPAEWGFATIQSWQPRPHHR